MRTDPLRLLGRRLAYEAQRRLVPGRLDRVRAVRYGGDLRMWVRPSDVVDRDIYLYGVHEYVATTVFTALASEGDVVVDAGAHVGAFTLLAAKSVGPTGRVLAFEPNPAQRERLVRNVADNGLTQVDVRPEALSDHTGEALLHLSADETRSGNASLAASAGAPAAVPVTLTRLDDLLGRLGIGRVALMKLDVEGVEPDVLSGASATLATSRPAVLFEVNGIEESEHGVTAPAIEVLRRHGYALYGMAVSDEGSPLLVEVEPGEDPRPHREPWCALNLLALHPLAFADNARVSGAELRESE